MRQLTNEMESPYLFPTVNSLYTATFHGIQSYTIALVYLLAQQRVCSFSMSSLTAGK